MEENKLISRMRSLESFAATNPGLYRFRVALLASVGYAYLFLVVMLLLALVAAILFYGRLNAATIKIVWIPLVLIGFASKFCSHSHRASARWKSTRC